jgi:16S rRNA (guanine527-N7)-methyltransferase
MSAGGREKVRALPSTLGPNEFREAFGVSRETTDRLELYARLLEQWQKTINLVAPSTLAHIWHRHFADSAQLVRLAPPDARTWIDLGSGAGFPGLVVAMLLAETNHCEVTLVESDTRKCAFLREVARQTGIAVDISNARIETLSTQARIAAVDVISARALAPLDRLFELCESMFARCTQALFLKGREVDAELEAARRRWAFESCCVPSLTDTAGRIVRVRALRAKTEDVTP